MVWPSSNSGFLGAQLFMASIMLADNYVRVKETEISDVITRFLHRFLPISWQNRIRESGFARFIVDVGAYPRAIQLAVLNLQQALDFWNITAHLKRFQYGDTPDHIIEVFEPLNSSPYDRTLLLAGSDLQSAVSTEQFSSRTLVFVHGGAWGCGRSWHYRMVANGLGVKLGVTSVVVVGYPTYPLSSILGESECVAEAVKFIQNNDQVRQLITGDPASTMWDASKHSIVLSGHSSGANICALALLNNVDATPAEGNSGTGSNVIRTTALNVDTFISLAGVFDIGKHYLFESNRGVQLISPMCAAACGRKCFGMCSPTTIARGMLRRLSRNTTQVNATGVNRDETAAGAMRVGLPRMVLIHGRKDAVVPHSSSEEFCAALKALGCEANVYTVEVSVVLIVWNNSSTFMAFSA
jgi:acetyl esterase/lipase